ncbi:MAG: hypothetical protein KAR42_02455 [candidate division Zixibacteria bacterium]|nr:hypothetical protein [candidate division Zixibacteria bacterium]
MEKHAKIIAWLYIAKTVLGLAIVFGISGLMFGAGVLSEDQDAMGVLAIMAVVASYIAIMISIPQLIGAWGMLKRKSWARVLIIIVSILNLFVVPFGTALGIYALVILFREDAKTYFT